jgi:hypothetical protein
MDNISSDGEFTRRFREPTRIKLPNIEDRCPRHSSNLKASMIMARNPNQYCFQCQFEDELYEPGSGSLDKKKSNRKKKK